MRLASGSVVPISLGPLADLLVTERKGLVSAMVVTLVIL
jgi:hypothetical protein